jgi:hypothetical protein
MSDDVSPAAAKKKKGPKRIRWWIISALLGAMFGFWVRSQVSWDQLSIPLTSQRMLGIDSCGGVVVVYWNKYEQPHGRGYRWVTRDPHEADSDISVRRAVGIMFDFPWDRPSFLLHRGSISAYPPQIPVGYSSTEVHFPYWLPAALLAIPLSGIGLIRVRQAWRGQHGSCPGCGQDLRTVESETCPTCGAAVRRKVTIKLAVR